MSPDQSCRQAPPPRAGTVHSGFLKQLDALVSKADGGNTITRVVSQLSGGRPVGRVICTGHSLGAALSTLGEAGVKATWFVARGATARGAGAAAAADCMRASLEAGRCALAARRGLLPIIMAA